MAETKQDELTVGYGYKDKTGQHEYGKITEAALKAMQARIGVERVANLEGWEIEDRKYTPAKLRRMAMASGDFNPLYLDADYARKSPYGDLVVPPAAIMEAEVINGATDGFPGCHAWFLGVTCEWRKPLLVGDSVIGKSYVNDVRIKPSRTTGQMAVINFEHRAFNKAGEQFGTVYTVFNKVERSAAKEKAVKQKERGLAEYSPEDIEQIKRDFANMKRQGAEKRFWEDVNVGDEVGPIFFGPTSSAQRTVGEGGRGGFARGKPGDWSWSHKQVLTGLFERHPGLPFINEWGIPEVPVVIHNSNERCQRYLGLPGAYDAGYQRINWTTQLLTDYAGDHGFAYKMVLRFITFNIMGDTSRVYGKVTGKRQEGKLNIVEMEVWNQNQLGFKVTEGSAEVLLPSRANPDEIVWKNL